MRPGAWLRGLWRFYLEYTDTKIHAATVAAFAIFALLVFVDSFFAVLAIGVYIVPPVVFYVLERDPALDARDEATGGVRSTGIAGSRGSVVSDGAVDADGDGDTDSENTSGDTDTDSDTDSSTDTDDGDSDSDRDDGDTDR